MWLVMAAGTAWASAVAGCSYTGEVVAVAGGAVTVQVASVEEYGHSAGPARCAAAGQTATIQWTAPGTPGAAGVVVGAYVSAGTMDVWSLPAGHTHSESVTVANRP
jgi:hypothetical protein